MPINQLSTSNTFFQWVGATNQLITITNFLNDGGFFNTNSTIVISGSGVLNVLGTALVNTLLSNTINTRFINVTGTGEALNVANSAIVRGNVFVGGNVSIGNLIVRGAYNLDNPTLSNLALSGWANVTSNLNVQSSFSQMGTQTSFFAGRLDLLNTANSLNALGNVAVSKNISVTQNVVVGQNLVATRIFGTTGNITSLNVSTMNVDSNLNIFGTLNTTFLNVTNNLTVANLTVTSNIFTQSTTNISGGNISITGVVNTRNLIVTGSVLGDLNIDSGNVIVRQARNIPPGSVANGFARFLGTGYAGYVTLDGSAMRLGHNSSARSLTLDVNSTPVLNANSSKVVITGDLDVSGAITGDATGLTNVNYIASSDSSSSSLIFDGTAANGRTPNWVSSGIQLTTTIPAGIDTVDLSIVASILIESIGSAANFTSAVFASSPAITVQGSFGTGGGTGTFSTTSLTVVLGTDVAAGAGAPDLRYRVLRSGTVFYTSEWTQLSTPGSFFGLLNTIRDTAPITGASSTYTVEVQWRNAADIAEASVGTVSASANSYGITGVGTNFQAYLSSRQSLTIGGNLYPIAEIISPTRLRAEVPAPSGTGIAAGTSFTVSDTVTIPKLRIIRKAINLTGYRT